MLGLRHLDLTLRTPAENLACDEALLEACESGGGAGVLRFWEAREHFVVLGYANKARSEVNLEACRASQVPVLRRCSGGGTVLQGPGCLNYSLVLKIDGAESALQSITQTNCFVMQRNREALAALLGTPVWIEGTTDLALNDLKFSGNAQRRKRDYLLFHGTFLLDFDLALVQKFLLPPTKEPEYRRQRSHTEFLTRLPLPAEAIKAGLRKIWNATESLAENFQPAMDQLVREKYGREDWNLKW